MITDTQILSYYFKGRDPVPEAVIRISSITAAEFLLIQSESPHKPNYYPILPSRIQHPTPSDTGGASPIPRILWDSRKHAALGKHRTDQLVIHLGSYLPSYIEYGSLAIAQIINEGHEALYLSSISHLEKATQKKLRDRLRFLLTNKVECIALNEQMATVGVNLLAQFLERYETKQNARNTVNDILILGTSIVQAEALLTEDSLLRRFTAEVVGALCHERPSDQLFIDFETPLVKERREPLESKGYVNRGWQILERRGR
jgi:hypothetical protein